MASRIFLKLGPAIVIDRREVGSAVKRLAFGGEKRGQRPSTLTGDGGDGSLVPAVDIGALVAIDFHRNEIAVEDLGDLRIS